MTKAERKITIIENIESGKFVLHSTGFCSNLDCIDCEYFKGATCKLSPILINSEGNKFLKVLYPECFI